MKNRNGLILNKKDVNSLILLIFIEIKSNSKIKLASTCITIKYFFRFTLKHIIR